MADEKQSIRALRAFRAGDPVKHRDWGDMTGSAWKTVGSVNRPALAYACELWYTGSTDARNWWMDWAVSQEDPSVGHEGRELGSRIYDSWTVAAAAMALNAPAASDGLRYKLRQWMRRHWLLQALGAVPQSQGQDWYSGPTVTWTGMRSCSKKAGTASIRGLDNELDGMFSLALGIHWTSRRESKMVGPPLIRGLDTGLTLEEREAMRALVDGRLDGLDALGLFQDDLEGLCTRVPMVICRWSDGSAGTLVTQDIGTSTPPVYGMLMRGRQAQAALYLTTYEAGDHYQHGIAGESDGTWWARTGSRLSSIPLPDSELLYSIIIDQDGVSVEGARSNGDSPGPGDLDGPTRPHEDPTQTPRWQLEAAIRALDGGDRRMAHAHAEVAERLLR